MDDDAPLLLRVDEAARLLSLSRSQLYALMAEGKFPYVKLERSTRISRADILRWIEEHTHNGRSTP